MTPLQVRCYSIRLNDRIINVANEKAARQKYLNSVNGKATRPKYVNSVHGKASRKAPRIKYNQSEKGKA